MAAHRTRATTQLCRNQAHSTINNGNSFAQRMCIFTKWLPPIIKSRTVPHRCPSCWWPLADDTFVYTWCYFIAVCTNKLKHFQFKSPICTAGLGMHYIVLFRLVIYAEHLLYAHGCLQRTHTHMRSIHLGIRYTMSNSNWYPSFRIPQKPAGSIYENQYNSSHLNYKLVFPSCLCIWWNVGFAQHARIALTTPPRNPSTQCVVHTHTLGTRCKTARKSSNTLHKHSSPIYSAQSSP